MEDPLRLRSLLLKNDPLFKLMKTNTTTCRNKFTYFNTYPEAYFPFKHTVVLIHTFRALVVLTRVVTCHADVTRAQRPIKISFLHSRFYTVVENSLGTLKGH